MNLTLAVAQQSADFGAAKFAPSEGKKLLIIGQDLGAVGGLEAYTEGYIDAFDTHFPAGITTYTSLPSLAGLAEPTNWGAGDVHGAAYLTDPAFKHSCIAIGLYLVDQLKGIIAGEHDKAIVQLAQWIKATKRPVFLRIGYEFDGEWNHYKPQHYIKAWRHIVHLFDQEEVQNVAYVWQSVGISTPKFNKLYPGDEYVNWVGYSHFDGLKPGQGMQAFAEEHDKPLMIAEATPRIELDRGNPQAHWNHWFDPLFRTVYQSNRIKAVAYINADCDRQPMWIGKGWGDSRVQASPFINDCW